MARVTQKTWKTLLAVAGVLLVIGMLLSGFIVPVAAVVLLGLVVVAGIALVRLGGSPRG